MKLLKFIVLSILCVLFVSAYAQQQILPKLLPLPQSAVYDLGKFKIIQDFSIDVSEGSDKRLFDYANRFLRRLDGRTGLFFIQSVISENHPQRPAFPSLKINVKRKGSLEISEDESYTLSVKVDKIVLEAETDLGIMHGLETLMQLLSYDETGFYFPIVEIKDNPRFPWRGLMIDVASNFIPINVLKRNIDGMAMVKLNVLHLHLSNDLGWRIESKVFPKLHQMASDGLYYTQSQVKEIVQYANDRGISVVPEINISGRSSSILVAYPDLSAVQQTQELKRNQANHHSMLNLASEKTYEFLEKLVPEVALLFQGKYLHIGGDNINFQQFIANNKNQDFFKKNKVFTTLELQNYFTSRINKAIKKANKRMIGWEEISSDNLDKTTIVQVKNSHQAIFDLAIKNNLSILSFGYELDKMLPAQNYYSHDPIPSLEAHTDKDKKVLLNSITEKNILGGEILMWSDLVSSNSIDTKIWPRAAAIAERFWSSVVVVDFHDMYMRLEKINLLLEETSITHLSYPQSIMNVLSNQYNTIPLKVLLGTLEPYKIYNKNQVCQLYKTYSPFCLVNDAITADAYDARQFKTLVNSYIRTRSTSDRVEIDKYLRLWRDNHNEILRLSYANPNFKSIIKLSENLNQLAIIGLDILKHIENKLNVQKIWFDTHLQVINNIKKEQNTNMANLQSINDARSELVIIEDILILLDQTNADFAKKRISIEEHKK